MKKAFVIYLSALEVLDLLEDEQAGLLFRAVRAYQEGDAEKLESILGTDKVLRVAFLQFRQSFDRDDEKYRETSEARREAGMAGAVKRWQSMAKDSKNSKCHICHDLPDGKMAKIADKDKDIDKDIIKEKHVLTYVQKEKAAEAAARTPAQQRHDKFMAWLADNCPYIAAHYKLPSPELLAKLITTYGAEAVADECLNIENRLDKRKNYTNLYQTLNNWLKRDYGDDKANNAEAGREQRARSYAHVIQQLLDEDDRRAAGVAPEVQPVGAN